MNSEGIIFFVENDIKKIIGVKLPVQLHQSTRKKQDKKDSFHRLEIGLEGFFIVKIENDIKDFFFALNHL